MHRAVFPLSLRASEYSDPAVLSKVAIIVLVAGSSRGDGNLRGEKFGTSFSREK